MEILTITTSLVLIGILISKKTELEFFGTLLSIFSGIYLAMHLVFWSVSGYDYNMFVTKRNAFINTLEDARKSKKIYELASIAKDISVWNQKLEEKKYDNKVFMFKDYIDDRYESLKTIK